MMTRIASFLCMLLVLTPCGAREPMPAQDAVDRLDPRRSTALRDLVAEAMDEHGVPGLSLAVLRQGAPVFAAGFGTREPGRESPVGADTRFRVASVTKVLTAVAIFQLEEAGKLEIDRPARDYCREYPSKGVDPTVRHLLAHQSGIRHTSDREDTTIVGEFEPLSEVVPRFGGEELEFPAGSEVLYSSWGYTLLGCVIESVSGVSYWGYLREHILEPAGMTATVQDRPDFGAADFSLGFRRRGPRPSPSEIVDTRFKVPASGLISSAPDLLRFVEGLLEGELLRTGTLDRMLQPQSTSRGETGPFTLGWLSASGQEFGEAFYSSGSMEGTTAFLYMIPEREYAVAILANLERSVQEVANLIGPINELLLDR